MAVAQASATDTAVIMCRDEHQLDVEHYRRCHSDEGDEGGNDDGPGQRAHPDQAQCHRAQQGNPDAYPDRHQDSGEHVTHEGPPWSAERSSPSARVSGGMPGLESVRGSALVRKRFVIGHAPAQAWVVTSPSKR